jgi:sigma54-dependent transcription regulator
MMKRPSQDDFQVECSRVLLWLLLKSDKSSKVFAEFRDFGISVLLESGLVAAERNGDHDRAKEIARLKQAWDRADKGALAQSPEGKRALRLVRQWDLFESLALSCKKCLACQAIGWALLEPIRDALKRGNVVFFQKLAEAIEFRRSRTPATSDRRG